MNVLDYHVLNNLVNGMDDYYTLEDLPSLTKGRPWIERAIDCNSARGVKLLICKGGARIDDIDCLGRQHLFSCVIKRLDSGLNSAKCLLELGSDVNFADKNGRTALYGAVWNNNLETAKLLLKFKADVDFVDNGGGTPLFDAIGNKKLEMIKLLIEHGANVNLERKDGETPLFRAILGNDLDVIELLLKYGANVNFKKRNGETVFEQIFNNQKIVMSNRTEGLKRLIVATLLQKPNRDKPDLINNHEVLSSFWADCQLEIENLNQNRFAGCLYSPSLLDIFKEEDLSKLASISRNRNVMRELIQSECAKEYPITSSTIFPVIQVKLQKGDARRSHSDDALPLFLKPKTNQFPAEIWERILDQLPNRLLKEIVTPASH